MLTVLKWLGIAFLVVYTVLAYWWVFIIRGVL